MAGTYLLPSARAVSHITSRRVSLDAARLGGRSQQNSAPESVAAAADRRQPLDHLLQATLPGLRIERLQPDSRCALKVPLQVVGWRPVVHDLVAPDLVNA